MNMTRKTVLLAVATLLFAVSGASAEGSFTIGIGGNFFLNDAAYLDAISASYQHSLSDGLELHLGADLALHTQNEDADGGTVPSFLIPVDMGLNFVFPSEKSTFVFGTGLSPVFNFNPDQNDNEFNFYMGPYLRLAFRLKVHPIMSWYISGQQDLLIGGDDWINTSSRVLTGINFALSAD